MNAETISIPHPLFTPGRMAPFPGDIPLSLFLPIKSSDFGITRRHVGLHRYRLCRVPDDRLHPRLHAHSIDKPGSSRHPDFPAIAAVCIVIAKAIVHKICLCIMLPIIGHKKDKCFARTNRKVFMLSGKIARVDSLNGR